MTVRGWDILLLWVGPRITEMKIEIDIVALLEESRGETQCVVQVVVWRLGFEVRWVDPYSFSCQLLCNPLNRTYHFIP